MFNEEVKNVKSDWITFNNEHIIVEVTNFEPQHPACHPSFMADEEEELSDAELKGKNMKKFDCFNLLARVQKIKTSFDAFLKTRNAKVNMSANHKSLCY